STLARAILRGANGPPSTSSHRRRAAACAGFWRQFLPCQPRFPSHRDGIHKLQNAMDFKKSQEHSKNICARTPWRRGVMIERLWNDPNKLLSDGADEFTTIADGNLDRDYIHTHGVTDLILEAFGNKKAGATLSGSGVLNEKDAPA